MAQTPVAIANRRRRLRTFESPAATPSSVKVAWDPSVDNVSVAGYQVFRDKTDDEKGKVVVEKPEYTIIGSGLWSEHGHSPGRDRRVERLGPRRSARPWPARRVWTRSPVDAVQLHPGCDQRTAVVISWSPSSDNVGVVDYGIYRGLQRIGTSAEPTTTLDGLSCGTSYAYGVDAADSAGNRSLIGNVLVRTAACPTAPPPGDTTPPAADRPRVVERDADQPDAELEGVERQRRSRRLRRLPQRVEGGTVNTTSAGQTGLTCATSYAFAVVARDSAGSSSAPALLTTSTSACSTSPPPPPSSDTTPPTRADGSCSVEHHADRPDAELERVERQRRSHRLRRLSERHRGCVCEHDQRRRRAACPAERRTDSACVARDAAGNASPQAQLTASTSACSTQPPADVTAPSTPAGLGIVGAHGFQRLARLERLERQRRRDRLSRVRRRRLEVDRRTDRTDGLVAHVRYRVHLRGRRGRCRGQCLSARIGDRLDCFVSRRSATDGTCERRRDVAHCHQHRPELVGVDRQRRRGRVRHLPRRRAGRVDLDDDRDLLRPHVQHELHPGRRRVRRGRQSLGEDDGHGLDDRLPGHDAAVDADGSGRVQRHADRSHAARGTLRPTTSVSPATTSPATARPWRP